MPSKALIVLKANEQKMNMLREKQAKDIMPENKNKIDNCDS